MSSYYAERKGLTPQQCNIIRVIICIIVLLLICTMMLVKHFEQESRMKELSLAYTYEVYFTYVENRQSYHLYLMCNPNFSITDIIENAFTDEYFNSLKSRIDKANTPSAQTTVFLMNPTDEIPFGWEKSNLNISCNFDASIFRQNTICRITIPHGALTLANCEIECQ